MTKRLYLKAARRWLISEHDVEAMRLQLSDQRFDRRHPADDMDRLGKTDRRLQEFETHHLGNRICHPDIEPERTTAGALFYRVEKLTARREDFVGISQDKLSHFT